jgi:hypothetical protein
MSAPHLLALLAAVLVGSAGPAQEPAIPEAGPAAAARPGPAGEQDPALADLVAKVRLAHRGAAVEPLDRFKAALRFKSVVPDADSIELDIDATFLAPRYLRYRIEEPGKVLERGWDDRGAWSRIGDQVESIAGRENEQEREEIRQQVGLARQLLEFLDPAAILAGLDGAERVGLEELPVGRKETRSCEVVRGIAARFPLFQPPAAGAAEPRCGLRIYVDAANHRLVALSATPLGEGDRPAGMPEFVLLREYVVQQEVAVPTSLLVYRGAPGQGSPIASVTVRAIDVAPDGITKDTMRRPR